MTPSTSSISNRINVVRLAAYAVIVISLAVLVGWLFDITSLKSLLPNFPVMKPNTAVAFAITAIGLLCVAKSDRNNRWKNAAVICGGLVCLIGSLTLGEYLAGVNIGIDTLLVPASSIISDNQLTGRMSPHSAFNFTIVGISLALLNGRRFLQKTSEFLAFLVLTTTFGALLGQLYGSHQFYGSSNYNRMALHTTGLFFVCTFCLLSVNMSSSTVKLLTRNGLGGRAAYKLLPAVILIPTALGWLRVWGQERGLYDTGFGAALAIFFCVVLMSGVVLFFCAAIDKTDRRRILVEEELVEKERRYSDLFDCSQGMICMHDPAGIIIAVNPATFLSLGYESETMVGKNLCEFLPVENKPQFDAYLRKIENEGLASGYLSLVSKNGKHFVWRYQNILISEPGREPYVLGHSQDVTALLDAQKQLKNLSLTDELTGLYNRRGFLTMAEQQIRLERHEGTSRGLTLMFADMDGLKKINDVYGHETGSEAIRELSKIFSSSLRNSDLVARWGGDEFVILTIGSQDEDAELMTERISRMIGEYNAQSDRPYKLACSIGIAPIPLDGDRTFESIVAEADEAMYAEKQRRKASRDDLTAPQFATPIQRNALPALDLSNRNPLD